MTSRQPRFQTLFLFLEVMGVRPFMTSYSLSQKLLVGGNIGLNSDDSSNVALNPQADNMFLFATVFIPQGVKLKTIFSVFPQNLENRVT